MNPLLSHYIVDVEYPDVSGAELLEMLQTRDKLAEIEATLSVMEQILLVKADYRFSQQAPVFYQSLASFIDFQQRRQTQQIPTHRWWWYLDQLPDTFVLEPTTTPNDLFDNKSKVSPESKISQYA